MVFAALVGMALLQGPTTPLAGTVVDGGRHAGRRGRAGAHRPEAGRVAGRGAGQVGRGGAIPPRPPGRRWPPTNPYVVPTLWAVAPGHRGRRS